MEAPQATDQKWAPKETFQNELREVKRPVNNINNILSEERGALWCFNLSFFLSLCFFCSFRTNMQSLSLLSETKRSCLLLQNSSTPGPNPHLKWLSIELKASRRSQAGLFRLTLTQQPEAYAASFKTEVANAPLEENHLKRYVTSDKFIYSLCPRFFEVLNLLSLLLYGFICI